MTRMISSSCKPTLLAALFSVGCVPVSVPAPTTHLPNDLGEVTAMGGELKLHMLDGTAYHLSRWVPDQLRTDTIEGTGTLYGLNRMPLHEGRFAIPLDSVALAQIDRGRQIRPFGLSWLATMSTLWGALTITGVADPKSFCGSGPTFSLD
jgi:hypothetical protein